MRFTFLIASAVLIASPALSAQAAELTINVTGAGKMGMVRGAVYADAKSFGERTAPVAIFGLEPRDGRAAVTIHGLPSGKYAVSAFQDVNGNGSLDSGALGIPTEPFGISNNPSVVSGPPRFEDAAFDLGTANLAMTLQLGLFR